MLARYATPAALVACVAIAGCGSGGESSSPASVPGVPYGVASRIKSGMPRREVSQRLGRPILTSRPTGSAPSGCVYYAMAGRPPADVWQFCFDRRDTVSEGATLYSLAQPPPPADASAARAALLGRGDTICQVERASLTHPVKRLDRQLAALKRAPNRANHLQAARLVGPFNAVLRKTLSELSVFNAPIDRRPALAGYLDALRAQTRAMSSARRALAASQDQLYAQLVQRFSALGGAATEDAHRYGFSACAGVTFS